MAQPIIFSQVLIASNATVVVNAASAMGPVAFTLNSTVLDTQRRLLFTTGGNESTNKFTVVGLNQANNTVTEVVTGPNASTTQTVFDYKKVISITPLATTVGTVSVGTNGVGSSQWWTVNWHATPINIAFGVEVNGTVAANFTVQHTYDDPNNLQTGVLTGIITPTAFNNITVAGASATVDGAYTTPITAIRLLTNSGTGTLWFRMLQAGLASP